MLKKFRIKNNLTQRELANLIAATQVDISRYENGTRKPSYQTLDKLCKVLKLTDKQRAELTREFARKRE